METLVSRLRLRPRQDFFYPSLNVKTETDIYFCDGLVVETETETLRFETEMETQIEVVETIENETRYICLRLKFSKLSRLTFVFDF